jgi:hypothetical protein
LNLLKLYAVKENNRRKSPLSVAEFSNLSAKFSTEEKEFSTAAEMCITGVCSTEVPKDSTTVFLKS